jgi:hypothetical protein
LVSAGRAVHFELFAANQPKFLSMSMLHKNAGFSNQAQSGQIKPNQVIFQSSRQGHFLPCIN